MLNPFRCGLLSGLARTGAVCCTSHWPATPISFSHTRAVNTLTLLIKVSAMVTVYRRRRRTLFFRPGIISRFIMCIEIIRNNSLACGTPQLRFEPRLLSTSRSTAHGAQVLWSLGYMGGTPCRHDKSNVPTFSLGSVATRLVARRSSPTYLAEMCDICSNKRLHSALCHDYSTARTNRRLVDSACTVAIRSA